MYWHFYEKIDFGHCWDLKGKHFLFKKDTEIHTLFSGTYPSKPVVHHPPPLPPPRVSHNLIFSTDQE